MDTGNSDKLMILLPPVKRKDVERRAWLVVQEIGKSHIEEVGKQSIMRRTGISARDVRVLDPKLLHPSKILGRERAIVLNLEHVKAIVTATEMLILNPNNPGVVPFVSDLEHKLSNSDGSQRIAIRGSDEDRKDSPSGLLPEPSDDRPTNQTYTSKRGDSMVLPFEFRVLEICLKFVCKGLESETSTLEQEAYSALDKLSISISMLNLQRVKLIKSRLVALFGRVQKIRDELENLLNDDMDMAEMYLTDKIVNQQLVELEPDDETENDADIIDEDSDGDTRNNKNSSAILTTQKPRIEELEMLLEAYFVQTEGTLSRLSTMREYVDDTEDYIKIILDDKQNQLLQVGVVLSIAFALLNVANLITGLLGMNFDIPLLVVGGPRQFYEATIVTVGGCTFIFFIAIMWLKRKGLLG